MIELDASQVLTFPQVFKAREVVRRGFLSNLLFANVAGIFRYSEHVKSILDKLPTAKQGKTKKVSKQRAMLKALTAKALQGDTKAANTVLNLVMRLMTPDDVEGEEMELTKTDLQVLDEFKAAVISAASDENEGGAK